ncbi:legumain-like [Oppia nitens]|uniref:legumain-like n=1 Tax=Oppia nitens TaxID=1686743 RepID=UPI0023DAF74B|nr:legumain-like [Oppia nitens]
MKFLILLSLLYISCNAFPKLHNINEFNGTNWVVLTAGSNSWSNYRHQADVYHAYQVVRSHGIPDENIIVFHYDDIAHNKVNPTPGIVINRPEGSDVYKGVPKDYTGEEVTPENFLKVLSGDKELAALGKKVVNSGPNDHIFVFFDDHGAPDLVAFPHKYLYGEALANTLKSMHENKRYSKLVFYIEACESGSMFNKLLPKDINIYATTASSPTEPSYTKYWSEKYGTALGDEYSVGWIQNSEEHDLSKYTLQEQYEYTKAWTKMSHVQQYGDLSIAQLPVGQFLGHKKSSKLSQSSIGMSWDQSNNNDAHVMAALKSNTEEFERIVNGRQFFDQHLTEYLNIINYLRNTDSYDLLNTRLELNNRVCYHKFVDTLNDNCLNIAHNSYVLSKLYTFVNICEEFDERSSSEALNHLVQYCQQNQLNAYPTNIV